MALQIVFKYLNLIKVIGLHEGRVRQSPPLCACVCLGNCRCRCQCVRVAYIHYALMHHISAERFAHMKNAGHVDDDVHGTEKSAEFDRRLYLCGIEWSFFGPARVPFSHCIRS